MQVALPVCDVEVLLQTSKGGRTIVAAARFDTRILKYRPHLVITDLTVCDLRGVSSSLDAYRLQAGWTLLRKLQTYASKAATLCVQTATSCVQAGWETLLRKLLSVPAGTAGTAGTAAQGSPAILHLESWDRFPMGGCRNVSGRTHHEVSVFYRVPVAQHSHASPTRGPHWLRPVRPPTRLPRAAVWA